MSHADTPAADPALLGVLAPLVSSDAPAGAPRLLRLAAVPSAAAPRALLPIPATRAHVRALMRPRSTRLSASQRLIAGLVRAAPPAALIRLGTRLRWEVDRPSPALEALSGLARGGTLGAIVNPSAPERPVYLVFAPDGGVVAAGKFDPAGGRGTARREHAALEAIHSIGALRESVPTPLGLVSSAAGDLVLMEPVLGDPAPARLDDHLRRWLRRCDLPGTVAIEGSPLVRALVKGLAEPLRRQYDAVLERAGDRQVQRAVVHGDFVPWNVVVDGPVVRVYDWELAQLDGLAGWDAAHFEAQVELIQGSASADVLVRQGREQAATAQDRVAARAVTLLCLIDLAARLPQDAGRREAALRQALETGLAEL